MDERWVTGSAFLAGITLGVLGLYLLGYRPTTSTPAPTRTARIQSDSTAPTPPSEFSFASRTSELSVVPRGSPTDDRVMEKWREFAQFYQQLEGEMSSARQGNGGASKAPPLSAVLPPPTFVAPPPEPTPAYSTQPASQSVPAVVSPVPSISIPDRWRLPWR